MTSLPALGVPLLFDYLFWIRDRVLAAAQGLDDHAFQNTPTLHGRDLRATLVHEIDIEIGWRGRLRGLPESDWGDAAGLDPARFPSLLSVADRWRAEEQSTRAWIAPLSDADLDAHVFLNRLEGYPLSIYLLHMVEHGVTELTTAAAILNELGRPVGDIGVLDALDVLAPMARTQDLPQEPAT
jgi:uncharacterized damage-inducible protein DinB